MTNVNPNSILFFYEGETDYEFYKRIFQKFLPKRRIRLKMYGLQGIGNINKKVKSKLLVYLDSHPYCEDIHVIVAHDREGPRDCPSPLNIGILNKEFVRKNKTRVLVIYEINATQDIESWFFNDIDGIYSFLRTPRSRRNPRSFSNTESLNYKNLAHLFLQNNKYYRKGKRVGNFLDHLDLEKILNNTPDLQNGIDYITSICSF